MQHNRTRISHGGAVLDMTEGNPYAVIGKFALPIFLSQVFQQLYNTADSLIVGKYLGTDALAAVSASGPLVFLLVSFFTGVSMGAGVIIARYFGAKDDERVSRAMHTNIALGIVSGIILTAVGIIATPFLLKIMKTDVDVLPEAIEYFRYYFVGGLALVMYNMCRGILNAVGDSRRPLYYLIFSSLLNIALDYLFVGILGYGVWSAALATVISQFASVVLCICYLLKKGNVFTLEPKKINFDKEMLIESIKYGLPAGIQNSVIAIANVIVQTQINSFKKFATAAFGAHAKIEGFAFLPITSFNMATTTFVGQNLGAGKHERAKKGARFGIISAVLAAEVIGVLCFIFAPWLIGAFDNDPKVIEYGVMQARTVALFYGLLAYSHSIAAVCRGAGKAFVPMFVMLSVWCVFRIIYILIVMELFRNIRYIYMAYPITWGISSVIYMIYYYCSDWVHGFDKKEKEKTNET